MIENLSKSPLFRGIEPKEIERLLSSVRYSKRNYSKDGMIVLQGDRCENMIILCKGKAVGGRMSNMGKYTVIDEMHAPKLFAPAFLYANENLYPVGVRALSEAEVIIIPRNEFTLLLQNNNTILFNFLKILSERSVFLSQKVKFFGMSLRGRLASYLLNQSKIRGNKMQFELPHTQQQLADFFGVARPSLARIIFEMKDENIISIDKKLVTINDINELQRQEE